MEEVGGTTLTDIAGGIVLPLKAAEFNVRPHCVAADAYDAGTGLAITPTAGTVPQVGSKDFILMGVHQFRTERAAGRPECCFNLGDDNNCVWFVDGDASQIRDASVTGPRPGTMASSDNFVGGSPFDTTKVCIASVRTGDRHGVWIHNPTPEHPNDFAVIGGVFNTTLLSDAGHTMGHNIINGQFDDVNYYSDYYQLDPHVTYSEDDVPSLGKIGGSFPGLWNKLPSANYSVPYVNKLKLGRGAGAGLDTSVLYYGIALFVFDSGLPSDWREALRWMRGQWLAGNKEIWPAWQNL